MNLAFYGWLGYNILYCLNLCKAGDLSDKKYDRLWSFGKSNERA